MVLTSWLRSIMGITYLEISAMSTEISIRLFYGSRSKNLGGVSLFDIKSFSLIRDPLEY